MIREVGRFLGCPPCARICLHKGIPPGGSALLWVMCSSLLPAMELPMILAFGSYLPGLAAPSSTERLHQVVVLVAVIVIASGCRATAGIACTNKALLWIRASTLFLTMLLPMVQV